MSSALPELIWLAGLQSAVVFFGGDRVPVAAGAPTAAATTLQSLVARLQEPHHLAGVLASKYPGAAIFV
jgi:hypothetical protein